MRYRLRAVVALVLLAATSAMGVEVAVLRNGFEIRHARSEALGESTRLYLSATPEASYLDVPTAEIVRFVHEDDPVAPVAAIAAAVPGARSMATPTLAEMNSFISTASDRHQVDADLIASVIRAESGFRARALSPKGAQGLMQLMPQTAAQLGVTDAFRAESNIDGGTRYLRELLVRYNDDIPKALAAYNAGPQRVEQYHGLPPFRETHAYVARVIRDFNRKKLQDRQKTQPARIQAKTAAPTKVQAVSTAAPKRAAAAAHPKATAKPVTKKVPPNIASAKPIPDFSAAENTPNAP